MKSVWTRSFQWVVLQWFSVAGNIQTFNLMKRIIFQCCLKCIHYNLLRLLRILYIFIYFQISNNISLFHFLLLWYNVASRQLTPKSVSKKYFLKVSLDYVYLVYLMTKNITNNLFSNWHHTAYQRELKSYVSSIFTCFTFLQIHTHVVLT